VARSALTGPIRNFDSWHAIAHTGRGYDSKSKDIHQGYDQAYRIQWRQINPPGWTGCFAVQPDPE
jgi:hypothetical protein